MLLESLIIPDPTQRHPTLKTSSFSRPRSGIGIAMMIKIASRLTNTDISQIPRLAHPQQASHPFCSVLRGLTVQGCLESGFDYKCKELPNEFIKNYLGYQGIGLWGLTLRSNYERLIPSAVNGDYRIESEVDRFLADVKWQMRVWEKYYAGCKSAFDTIERTVGKATKTAGRRTSRLNHCKVLKQLHVAGQMMDASRPATPHRVRDLDAAQVYQFCFHIS